MENINEAIQHIYPLVERHKLPLSEATIQKQLERKRKFGQIDAVKDDEENTDEEFANEGADDDDSDDCSSDDSSWGLRFCCETTSVPRAEDCVWNCCGVVNVLYWEIGRLDIQNGRFIFYSPFWLSNWVFPKKRKEAIHVFSSSFLQQKNEKTDYISLPDEISWSSTVLRSRCWFGECRRFWKPNSESFYQNWMIHPRDMIFQIFIHHFISVSTIKEQNELHWQ